ncbi:uncharacterized protein LOC134241507 isoform X2 [Saccostrea cucullata]|uniref:uncharacterized protein LOC134241507 isoform X2 n=1 Tax=Saccostrea cuccullata TaxID=36930 RepID=UPI002ED05F63
MTTHLFVFSWTILLTLCGAQVPDPGSNGLDRCEFGRHLRQRCVGFTIPPRNDCPAGFFCFTPADGAGPCCLQNNPCIFGTPLQINNDAVTCTRQRCPLDYRCISNREFAVCCPSRNPSLVCPQIYCTPERGTPYYPPFCYRPTTIRTAEGRNCPGCPRNICRPYIG